MQYRHWFRRFVHEGVRAQGCDLNGTHCVVMDVKEIGWELWIGFI
jgi:hypothetical protein